MVRILGVIMLSFFAPIIAEFALRFGPAEIFSSWSSRQRLRRLGGKDAIKTAFPSPRFLLACVGWTPSRALRLTYGSINLMGGFNFIVAVIGLFGLGEIFLTVEEGLKIEGKAEGSLEGREERHDRSLQVLQGAHPRNAHRLLEGADARRRDPGLLHGVRVREAGLEGQG
jgi:TctA family transporter